MKTTFAAIKGKSFAEAEDIVANNGIGMADMIMEISTNRDAIASFVRIQNKEAERIATGENIGVQEPHVIMVEAEFQIVRQIPVN